ncbi:MAG: SpoIIE family protein phosphatase [Caulobacteraceae bacterium]
MDVEHTRFTTTARDIDTGVDQRLHFLELIDGADAGRRHLIPPLGLTIGRVPPADLVIGDSEVSRGHCRVVLRGEELIVTDLNSTNGTRVDGVRIASTAVLPVGGVLQVGRQAFKHEWLTGKQLEKSNELDRDIATASSYIQALLPPPLREGPIRADWLYLPCAKLGGDAFGYGQIAESQFVGYLIDVSGHGAGAAMHSVAVMNLLRQRALPNTDMSQPGQVLETLNNMFQMESHAEMYFTMWYGVYDTVTRRLDFASAGHHPAYLAPIDRSEPIPLRTRNGLIGAAQGKTYKADSVTVPPGASIYIFSDGVFEIIAKDGAQWRLGDFTPLLQAPRIDGVTESERLFRAVRDAARPGEFDDDFTLVVMTFD